jgi:hypothetical protein
MDEVIVEFVLDERRWLFASILLSTIAVAVLLARGRAHGLPIRLEILWAMNLFYGCMIGTMALGHLTAVTVKTVQGILEGSLWILYPLGLALAIPAWWLAFRAGRYVNREDRYSKRIVALNSWLGVCLIALGLHSLPLAAPAALNIAYQFHSKRAVGWTIVTVAIAANLALFVGSMIFLASGQSFEQFQGMK